MTLARMTLARLTSLVAYFVAVVARYELQPVDLENLERMKYNYQGA